MKSTKKPCRGMCRRQGSLQLRSTCLDYLVMKSMLIRSGDALVPEISFFVSRLQHPSILYHDTDLPVKVQLHQKPLHGGRKYLGSPDFSAKLHKPSFFQLAWQLRHATSLFSPLTVRYCSVICAYCVYSCKITM